MAKNRGIVIIDTDRCKGCCLCVEACPTGLLQIAKKSVNIKGYSYVIQENWEQCNGCTSCAIVCPDACIEVYRKKE
jgi:2-oxoglutarate ferredoxin oxidoreductase subunit delta